MGRNDGTLTLWLKDIQLNDGAATIGKPDLTQKSKPRSGTNKKKYRKMKQLMTELQRLKVFSTIRKGDL